MSLSNKGPKEFSGNKTIRRLSGRGHAVGLDTPFLFSALLVYEAGGKLDKTTEKYMIQGDFLKANGSLSDDGKKLVELHTRRGDRPYLWSQDMVEKAHKAPKLVIAA